ncbi:unnamed protein product [Auanema sp. JU1783]|nr:unnamed protein product [Auanema sp. JU1783]
MFFYRGYPRYATLIISCLIFLGSIGILFSTKPRILILEDGLEDHEVNYSDDIPVLAPISRNNPNFPGIYVAEAFRVKNDTIRFVFLQHRENQKQLEAKVQGTDWNLVKAFCYNKTCDDILFCDIATRIAILRIDPTLEKVDNMSLAVVGNSEYFNIKVRDVRIKKENVYPHRVGVCLQPIFFYSDWPLIIQFFESWLAQGATKFYFYLHSYTKQTKLVLDFYKQKLGDNLEFVDWSDLPVHNRNRGDYNEDPNSRVFRHAATAFMHDCMLRARSHVKYVANFDLDDFPFAENGDIGETLDEIMLHQPIAGQVVVEWLLAKQTSMDWDSINRPIDVPLSLSDVKLFSNSSVRWDYRVSNKIFHRPERVVVFDMHTVYRNERLPLNRKRRFETAFALKTTKIFCLHLRRFERHIRETHNVFDRKFDYSLLEGLSEKMERNFKIRTSNSVFGNKTLAPWAMEAREIMRNLEQCRREAFGKELTGSNKMCQQSSSGCLGMLMSGTEFEHVPISWQDVAHTAIFNNYLESN